MTSEILGIKQFIPRGFCLKCDGCCRFACGDSVWPPRLLKEEEKLFRKDQSRLARDKKDGGFLCIFLRTNDNRCAIYRKRPFECRLYPFLLNRSASSGREEVFLAVDANCPFVIKSMKKERFKKSAEYITSLLKKPSFLKILKRNPHIAQQYPDVINLAKITPAI